MRTFRTTTDQVLNAHFCRKQTLLQKRKFGTAAYLVLNVHWGYLGQNKRGLNVLFGIIFFLMQKRTFRTTADLVLNVRFCRSVFLLQKRTFRTTADLVLNVHLCRKQTPLQKRTFRPPCYLFKKGHNYEK